MTTETEHGSAEHYHHFHYRLHEPDLDELNQVAPRRLNMAPITVDPEALDDFPHKLHVEFNKGGGWERMASYALVGAIAEEVIDPIRPQSHAQ